MAAVSLANHRSVARRVTAIAIAMVALVLLAPLLALMLGLPGRCLPVLLGSLLLGTPVLSLLGAVGAALTVGLKRGGLLLALLILPIVIVSTLDRIQTGTPKSRVSVSTSGNPSQAGRTGGVTVRTSPSVAPCTAPGTEREMPQILPCGA